ncbi:hypothetical protein GF339_17340, partial [candidate division KSB3 bacterium]|nr:hypothetical protein [candidate division KSB3 bacterium]MBD3326353.1 hypothetical protein [candidate division KSB3 bacterium]
MHIRKICNTLIELGIIALIIFPPLVFGAVQPRHVTSIHLILLAIGLIWVVKTFAKHVFLYVPGPLDLPLLLFLGLGFINLTAST